MSSTESFRARDHMDLHASVLLTIPSLCLDLRRLVPACTRHRPCTAATMRPLQCERVCRCVYMEPPLSLRAPRRLNEASSCESKRRVPTPALCCSEMHRCPAVSILEDPPPTASCIGHHSLDLPLWCATLPVCSYAVVGVSVFGCSRTRTRRIRTTEKELPHQRRPWVHDAAPHDPQLVLERGGADVAAQLVAGCLPLMPRLS
ncbi:hypothetical protein B0H19DRAFT_542193 [Mycena capillaripes]|nr:hypothetical protein B0H19DRAFT_542193 [Mycena capillaripes]